MALLEQQDFPAVSDLLRKMISFDTVNAGISGKTTPEAPLVDCLEELAGSSGFETRRLAVPGQSDELLVQFQRDPSLPWVLFDSHLDTVSVEGMVIEPFAGQARDGRIWGRGACDTKGTGAAMFKALSEYSSQSDGNNNVALLFSTDEEWGMTGIRAFAGTHIPELGFPLKGAIIGEPTSLEPVIAHNGAVRYVVRTRGVAVHSSNPSLGKSAISSMARLIVSLENGYVPGINRTDTLTGKAQSSINVIKGGTAANIIPEACEVFIDRRVVPGETTADVVRGFEKAIADFQSENPDDELSWDVTVDTPALDSATGGTFSASVLNTMSSLGLKCEGVGVAYATHAGDLSIAGVPSVVLGPGSIDQGHTKDEWIDIAELEEGVRVYLALMADA
jgi:acetylornithine deacetylase